MRLRVLVTSLLLSLSACATRIQHIPVPADQKMQSQRLVLEGSLLLQQGKDHLALLRFVEASTLNPYDPVIFNKLAITYSRLLRFREAGRAIQRSVRLDPEYANAFNTQGILFLAAQREKKAIRSFQKAIRLRPQTAIYYLNLGAAYLNRGQYKQGRKAYRQALEIDPDIMKLEGAILISASDREAAPEKFFQMSLLFAELGDRDNSLFYLGKALAGGFRDAKRIAGEPALARLLKEREFINLVLSYGLDLPGDRSS